METSLQLTLSKTKTHYFTFRFGLLLMILFSFFNCDVEAIDYQEKKQNETSEIYQKMPGHRGIYIDNFLSGGILGNTMEENKLINWCLQNNFNKIYLYNIHAILQNTSYKIQLDAFVEKVHNLYPKKIDVTFVSGGMTSLNNTIQYHKDYINHPKGVVSEIEFWNSGGSFTDFKAWMNQLDNLKSSIPFGYIAPLNPNLKKRFYIGKILDNEGVYTNTQVAEELVINHDEIFLANYHTNAYNLSTSTATNSIKNRLILLAETGYNLNKKVNIVILFNMNTASASPHIYDYFDVTNTATGNHKFHEAHASFMTDYLNATDIPHKNFLNMKGYGIYKYSEAKIARPYEPIKHTPYQSDNSNF